MNPRRVAALQAVVTVILLALLFRGVDWRAFAALYTRLPLWFYAGSLAVVLAGLTLYAWRWHVLLRFMGVRLPFALVLEQYFIGVFMNNFLPSTVGGDAVKVFYLGRGHGYRAITASVVLDRVLGVGLLAVVATVLLWLEPARHARFLVARLALSAITLMFLAVIVIALVGTGGLPARLQRLGTRAVSVARSIQAFRLDVAGAVRSPIVWVHAALTVLSYAALVTVVYQAFVLLQTGQRPGFAAVLMVLASVAVLSNVPFAINGIGLREQLHVLLLEPLGISKELAVAISLLVFAHLLIASAGGGFLWWRAMRRERLRTHASVSS